MFKMQAIRIKASRFDNDYINGNGQTIYNYNYIYNSDPQLHGSQQPVQKAKPLPMYAAICAREPVPGQ